MASHMLKGGPGLPDPVHYEGGMAEVAVLVLARDLTALTDRAGREGVSTAQLIRRAIRQYLAADSDRPLSPERMTARQCNRSPNQEYPMIASAKVRHYRKDEDDLRWKGFVEVLAHELVNALVPLRYGVAIVRQAGPESEAGRRAFDLVARHSGRIAELLDGLLDLARAEHEKLELQLQPVDLAEVAHSAAEVVGSTITSRRHQLRIRIHPAVGEVWADPARLQQVLTNLLANAAKYTEPGGKIDLTAERKGKEVVIRVRDNGIGIAHKLLPQLFTRYVQADPREGGLGIGLALVKMLVELHGGTVTARSDGPGTGSEFVIRLPGWRPQSSE